MDRRLVLPVAIVGVLGAGAVLRVSMQQHLALLAVFGACAAALVVASSMIQAILAAPGGSRAMRAGEWALATSSNARLSHPPPAVSNPIQLGAEAFFRTQYAAIAKISMLVALALLLLYLMR